MNCVFCKIIKGELPSEKVYEDGDVLAILDIRPVSAGHSLVMPKAHVLDLASAPAETLKALLPAVQKVGNAIIAALGVQGFNVGINNGRAAGQIVDHLHIHVIPRSAGDRLKLWPQRDYASGEMTDVADKIRKQLT